MQKQFRTIKDINEEVFHDIAQLYRSNARQLIKMNEEL